MIDFDPTDQQRVIQETARDFASREVIPRARDMDRAYEGSSQIQKLIVGRAVTGVDTMT
ncbi:MAG: hypothetical protein H0U12_00485 [Thermoleophilaceae bacterium]|jgi:alkylation response protein AidB-like acyl-CoA dehydrogenase|nr:hypothetical protein [Thermoleophilaceae bacterium]